jgi:hypothetical protein
MEGRPEKVRLPRLNSPGLSRGFNLLTGPIIIPVLFFGCAGAVLYAVGPPPAKRAERAPPA